MTQSNQPQGVVMHPIQPLVLDKHNVLRFKANAIVKHLIDKKLISLNDLAMLDFPREDWDQFHQLIGYSHSGIPDCNTEVLEAAETAYRAGVSEVEARNAVLRDQLEQVRIGMRDGVAALYGIHPDDIGGSDD